MNPMNLLIAGGAGFIGSNLICYLLEKYPAYKIVNLDNLSTGSLENLGDLGEKENYNFVQGDVCNEELVEKIVTEQKIEAIVNLASDPASQDFIRTDVYGNFVLLEAARKNKVKKFVYVSSDEVYGETETKGGTLRPSIETDPLRPQTPQAAAKAGADVLAFSYYKSHNLPMVILRPSNIFGPSQTKDRLIPLLITNALQGKALPIFGDGKHTRDLLYIDDFLTAMDLSLHDPAAIGRTFNVSGGFEHSILEVSELALTMLDKPKTLIEFVEDVEPHTRRRALDSSKITKVLKWKPTVDFMKGLEKTIKWYKATFSETA